MKKLTLLVTMILFSNCLFARTIETTAKFDTAYDYVSGSISTYAVFGKITYPGDYGIFLNVRYPEVADGDGHTNLFYRLTEELINENKELFVIIDNEKIVLANKKWYGWKTANNINIKNSMIKTPYPEFKVWIEIK